MTYKPRSERKRARGGKAEGQPIEDEHGHQYNAQGSPEEKSEFAKSDGFKRGGAKKRKAGGKVEGERAKHHLGKRARGGMMPKHEHEHRAHGGMAGEEGGESAHERAEPEHEKHGGEVGHRARGGRTNHMPMARGGSPFSSARKLTDFENEKNEGPGEKAPVIP